ncbi:hypothetical protein Pmani_025984 [Petrolisthes manimaculis]|uniref:Uncharacterized protein n=1 Tax=Petrolisthes manimaculis TaxID=1843537 RepID=A0AAE1P6Z2_9EUCA|nr:hypothetical protein Pmani_025984 [Petrolisthes manimaculis]
MKQELDQALDGTSLLAKECMRGKEGREGGKMGRPLITNDNKELNLHWPRSRQLKQIVTWGAGQDPRSLFHDRFSHPPGSCSLHTCVLLDTWAPAGDDHEPSRNPSGKKNLKLNCI